MIVNVYFTKGALTRLHLRKNGKMKLTHLGSKVARKASTSSVLPCYRFLACCLIFGGWGHALHPFSLIVLRQVTLGLNASLRASISLQLRAARLLLCPRHLHHNWESGSRLQDSSRYLLLIQHGALENSDLGLQIKFSWFLDVPKAKFALGNCRSCQHVLCNLTFFPCCSGKRSRWLIPAIDSDRFVDCGVQHHLFVVATFTFMQASLAYKWGTSIHLLLDVTMAARQ